MNIENLVLELCVNGLTLYFLLSSFMNIDLLQVPQIFLISNFIMSGYLINKKVLRDKKCKISWKQLGVGFSISVVNFVILLLLKKLF